MTEAELHRALVAEGIPPALAQEASSTTWSDGPGQLHAAHRHGFDKVLLVLEGSIRFELLGAGREVELSAGERLDLPDGTLHVASVGPAGVRCLEVHLPAGTLAGRVARDPTPAAGSRRETGAAPRA